MGLAAMLSACGGGGGGGSAASAGGETAATPPAATTPTGTCTLRARQDWAAAQLREWYLFPETLPAALDPSGYATVDAYIDALTATARAQRKDRFFTYLTSIAEENAFNASGATGGFGIRLSYNVTAGTVFVTEAFEGTPAAAAGLDRGVQIVAIGTNAGNLRPVTALLAADGAQGVVNALGPDTPGTTRVLSVRDAGGLRDVTIAKADYNLAPVSDRYGVRIVTDNGRPIGYLNLRNFTSAADPQLRAAFARFRAAGVTELVVDLRYNGGGRLSTAALLGNLLGGNRATSDVFSRTVFRPEKAQENSTDLFAPQPESVSPMRIAFIGLGGTASASELVIAAFVPYLGDRAVLVGQNTFGKPVGQIALDRAACDDRLRVVALATQNADRRGDYYDGLLSLVRASCTAGDDLTRPLGDPAENMLRIAIDAAAGRPCVPIIGQGSQAGGRPQPLVPDQPSPAQRETPGLF